MPLKLHHHDAETLQRRKRLSRTWAGIVVVWSIIRTIIVWAAVGDYGLNPWVYLSLDLGAAIVDALSTPRMVLSFIDDHYKQAVKWAVISLGVFIVPDIYIFFGTRELPRTVIVVLCLIIGATLAIGVFSVVRKIKKGRAERRLAK
ncbi:MAG: LapA family protein [Ilumatobacteraceae bacterium]